LLVDFYPKEYLDNAQYWLNRQDNLAAQRELDGFFSLPFSTSREDRVTGFLLQSLLHGRAQRTSSAIRSADSALALDPSNWRAYEYRGNFYYTERDSGKALADWEKSLLFNPSNPNILQNIRLLRRETAQQGRPR
jgi:tetratricopeptide (TPR) repeat protein